MRLRVRRMADRRRVRFKEGSCEAQVEEQIMSTNVWRRALGGREGGTVESAAMWIVVRVSPTAAVRFRSGDRGQGGGGKLRMMWLCR